MAGIFNLFGKITEPDKGQLGQPLLRSKSSFEVNTASLKVAEQSRPKGLSIRSRSDMNISTASHSDSLNQDAAKLKYLKLKLTQVDANNQLISPSKQPAVQKLNERPKAKGLFPVKAASNKRNTKHQRPFDEDIFKKPLPPKKLIKKVYAEPENLAPYINLQSQFDDVYTKKIESEFKELIKEKQSKVEDADEGFSSDPELIEFDLPNFCVSPTLNEDWKKYCSIDLPEISDIEDNI